MTIIADYTDEIRNTLTGARDSATWPTALVEAALRTALRHYQDVGPVSETSFTVVSASYEQDLSTIANIYRVVGVAWPWDSGDVFWFRQLRFREVATLRVYLETRSGRHSFPQLDDTMRVRYRQFARVQYLDNHLDATTVPDRDQQAVVIGAAGYACRTRALDLAEDPAVAKDAARILQDQSEKYIEEFQQLLLLSQERNNPDWNEIGLR